MPVSSEIWNQITTTTILGSASPPPTRSQLTLNEVLAQVELNFADYWGNEGQDCSIALQAFLDYAGRLALILKGTVLDDQNGRNCIRATIPRGNWFITRQIIVPEWVDLNIIGSLCRTRDGSADGGPLWQNPFLPMIAYVTNSMASRVNIYCNMGKQGGSGPDVMGSGVCFGKNWSVVSVAISAAGSNYGVGDLIFLEQPSKLPYTPASVKVTSIGTGGKIVSVVIDDGGSYSRRPRSGGGMVSFADIQGLGVSPLVQNSTLAQQSTTRGGVVGPGSGASFVPTWTSDFASTNDDKGSAVYQAGRLLLADTYIGQVRVKGAGVGISKQFGAMFGVRLNLFNAEIDRLEVDGGYYGIIASCVDTRVNCINAVLSMVGMIVEGSAFLCPMVMLDTCFICFLEVMAGSQSIHLAGRTIWPKDNNALMGGMGSINCGYCFLVGHDSSEPSRMIDGLRLDFSLANSGSNAQNGGKGVGALFVANIQNSHINIETSNMLVPGESAGTQKKIKVHSAYGPLVMESMLLTGNIDGISGAPAVSIGSTVRFASVASGGAGYAIGDVIKIVSSGSIVDAIVQVLDVSAGAVSALRLLGPGLYSMPPTISAPLPTVNISGSGSGLTVWLAIKASATSLSGGIAVRDGDLRGWIRDGGVCEFAGNGVPSGTTGQYKAEKGSRYINNQTGESFINSGTASTPVWKKVAMS